MDAPQVYLSTPRRFELSEFPARLAACLDGVEIACVRLALDVTDADEVARAADAIRPVCHERDVALVVEDHAKLVERLGLDGVHLRDPRKLREVRKALGPDPIVGVFCGTSRHDGMTAGEIGATYVSFGPVTETGLGTGGVAPLELFQWWSEMIELPVVAEGGMTRETAIALAPYVDFLAPGGDYWSAEDPVAALARALGR